MKTVKVDGVEISVAVLESSGYVKKVPEEYHFIGGNGHNDIECNDGDMFDQYCIDSGNCHATANIAKKYGERICATQRVLDKLRSLEPDGWEYNSAMLFHNYTICYDNEDSKFIINSWLGIRSLPLEYYSTESAWKVVLEELLDDVCLIFGIKR